MHETRKNPKENRQQDTNTERAKVEEWATGIDGCEAQHFKRKDESEVKTTTHFKQFINETIDEIMFPLRLRVTLGLQFAFVAIGPRSFGIFTSFAFGLVSFL